MNDLAKFSDIPFDQAAADTVNAQHNMLLGVIYGDCNGLEGKVSTRFSHYEADAYEYFRIRDLHILNNISKVLPLMDNSQENAVVINNCLNHDLMNTLEGTEAMETLVHSIFPSGPVADRFKTLNGIPDLETFSKNWKEKFGHPSAITPEEYRDENLPPLPSSQPKPNTLEFY